MNHLQFTLADLEDVRVERRMSVLEFADVIGISPGHYYNWQHGKTPFAPQESTRRSIAESMEWEEFANRCGLCGIPRGEYCQLDGGQPSSPRAGCPFWTTTGGLVRRKC